MDVQLWEKLKPNFGCIRTKIINADRQPAQPGDLLFEDANFGDYIKGWLSSLNQDTSKKFNICSRHATTLDGVGLESQEGHSTVDSTVFEQVIVACRGNGQLMRSGKNKKGTTEDSDSDNSDNDEDTYEFINVQSIHLLNMKQIQQLQRSYSHLVLGSLS